MNTNQDDTTSLKIVDISEKECRDAKFRVSTRVLDNAYLISGDV
ncbi:hypothetical protein [Nostoc sp.]|nr:hypothetical protein [Nostoc sp. S13]